MREKIENMPAEDFWNKAVKDKHITNLQKERLLDWYYSFQKETKNGHTILSWNGIIAVGKLRKPLKHHPKEPPVNDYWIIFTSSSTLHRSIQFSDFYVTREEAADLSRCIQKALKEKREK